VGVGRLSRGVNSQTNVAVSVLVSRDRALDGVLRRSLGDRTVRAEGSLEVGDVPGADVVDETCSKSRRKECERVDLIRNERKRGKRWIFNSPWT